MSSWYKDILRFFGLTNDTRVHVSAPGVDVMITGEPERVRHLLGVVKSELEKPGRRGLQDGRRFKTGRASQVVQPTELDEMDSPYALPEADAMVKPVLEEHPTDEVRRKSSRRRPSHGGATDVPDTVLPRSDLPRDLDPPTMIGEVPEQKTHIDRQVPREDERTRLAEAGTEDSSPAFGSADSHTDPDADALPEPGTDEG